MTCMIMKCVGIAIMILAHPFGLLSGKVMTELFGGLEWEVYAGFVAAGSIEAFLLGAALLLIGISRSSNK